MGIWLICGRTKRNRQRQMLIRWWREIRCTSLDCGCNSGVFQWKLQGYRLGRFLKSGAYIKRVESSQVFPLLCHFKSYKASISSQFTLNFSTSRNDMLSIPYQSNNSYFQFFTKPSWDNLLIKYFNCLILNTTTNEACWRFATEMYSSFQREPLQGKRKPI